MEGYAHCKFCERNFRSTPERMASGVCSICNCLLGALIDQFKYVGKNSVDKILKAAENDSTVSR